MRPWRVPGGTRYPDATDPPRGASGSRPPPVAEDLGLVRMPVARLLPSLVPAGTMVVAMDGIQPRTDAIALSWLEPDAPASVTARAFSLRSTSQRAVSKRAVSRHAARAGGSTGARLVQGVADENGCHALSVRRGGKVLLRIPSHRTNCCGGIRIHTKGRYMRTSPVPLMQRFAVAGRRMATTGADGGGRELWLRDSRMMRLDLRPGSRSSNPRDFREHGRGRVRFVAEMTDGTIAGTHKVR